jgi:hypothetical protein
VSHDLSQVDWLRTHFGSCRDPRKAITFKDGFPLFSGIRQVNAGCITVSITVNAVKDGHRLPLDGYLCSLEFLADFDGSFWHKLESDVSN